MDVLILPKEIKNKIKIWSLRAIIKFGMPDIFYKTQQYIKAK